MVVDIVQRRKSLRVIERAATYIKYLSYFHEICLFLGTLAKLRKATISFLMSVYLCVRPSVCMEEFGFHLTEF